MSALQYECWHLYLANVSGWGLFTTLLVVVLAIDFDHNRTERWKVTARGEEGERGRGRERERNHNLILNALNMSALPTKASSMCTLLFPSDNTPHPKMKTKTACPQLSVN